MKFVTPLRYPGGKANLAKFFGELIKKNNLCDGLYVEPYAGGAGVALALLLEEYVDSIYINDIDPAVWAFWQSVVEYNRELSALVSSARLTVEEWNRQKTIYRQGLDAGVLELGFAMFYLNRTNRSGILNGGIIGGKAQNGEWKIDARFNREDLAQRIRRIARYRSRIQVTNEDAVDFLRRMGKYYPRRTILYLDPPYYEKGQRLYRNYYCHDDHRVIAETVTSIGRPWVVSYDDHLQIRKLYSGYKRKQYKLDYTARDRHTGAEVMFFAKGLSIPSRMKISNTG